MKKTFSSACPEFSPGGPAAARPRRLPPGRHLLAFAAALVSLLPAAAQSGAGEGAAEAGGGYRWDVNVNLLPVVRDVRAGRFELLARRRYAGGAVSRALRLRFDMEAAANDDRTLPTRQTGFSGFPTPPGNIRQERRLELGLVPGHEWRREQGRFAFIYGVDVPLRYASGYLINEVIPQSNPDNKVKTEGTSYSAGVSGFMGMRCVFGRHFSVGAETHLTYLFTRIRNTQTIIAPVNVFPNQWELGARYPAYESNRHDVAFSPLRALYIGYQF